MTDHRFSPKQTHLSALPWRASEVRRADAALRATVEAARTAGATWAEIAAGLEVTRQAAQQRYGKPAER